MSEMSAKEVTELLETVKTVHEHTAQEIAKLHKILVRLFLIIPIAFALVIVLLLGSIHQAEKISCLRSNVVRYSLIGEYNYALHAATARLETAKVEMRNHQYTEAKINITAAHNFQLDASRIHVQYIPCTGLFPSSI